MEKKIPRGKNEGGPIEHLKIIMIEYSLGICAELYARMQHIVDTNHDEWEEVGKDPVRRAKFKQFVNTDENQPREELIKFTEMRGQKRPTNFVRRIFRTEMSMYYVHCLILIFQ